MTKTPLLRHAAVALLFSLAACDKADKGDVACPDCPPKQAAPAATTPAIAASPVKRLQPWETYDAAFNGCAGGCGMRMAAATDGVLAQPGAMLGQTTYCPVSGVAFEVKATSTQRKVGDQLLYFCCEACAQFFTLHQASILAARGIAA